jgi:alanyl-tRNA synthetase
MQFDQAADGTRVPLPKPSIDTGMGLERIAAILQGVHSNYDIDVFRALIGASEALTGVKADGEQAASHRVIADHLRASSFLIADGVLPSNEGRGSVLRRIMRRAMRHAHGLGAREPLMHRLAPSLADAMGDAYPELRRAQPLIQSTLEQEEERFRRTLSRGLDLLADATSQMRAGDSLSGETAFTLYDTYGFPVDLTADILRARGITVDQEGFETAMERQREQGRESWAGSGEAASGAVWLRLKDTHGATDFLGYGAEYGEARLIAIVQNGETVDRLSAGAEAELVFDRTPFYAESGGQAGDHGAIRFAHGAAFTVRDTRKQAGALHGHLGTLDAGKIAVGDMATLDIDAGRRARIRANHSATHLLHAALRNVLGPGVTQKGSLVEADRLRFDFSHGQPMTPEAIERVEAEVNAVIRQNAEARIIETSPEEAIAAGAMALFGEKYGERVRVLTLGSGLEDSAKPYSVELCGGTHVARTGDIALFAILSESGVAAGIRRIEATTGAAALAFLKGQAHVARALSEQLRTPIPALAERVAQIADERRRFERDLADARTRLAMAGPATGAASGPETVAGVHFLSRVLSDVPAKDLRRLIDEGKVQVGSGVVVYVTADGGKAAIAVGVTDDLVGRLSAVDLVKAGVAALGGQGGGGRADLAQGGGPDAGACEAAVAAVRAALAG